MVVSLTTRPGCLSLVYMYPMSCSAFLLLEQLPAQIDYLRLITAAHAMNPRNS